MDSAAEFETVRKSLTTQAVREIKIMKRFLEAYDQEALDNDDGTIISSIVERILFSAEGLKKIGCVMEYMDAWEENGDPPQLKYAEEDSLLKAFLSEEDRA